MGLLLASDKSSVRFHSCHSLSQAQRLMQMFISESWSHWIFHQFHAWKGLTITKRPTAGCNQFSYMKASSNGWLVQPGLGWKLLCWADRPLFSFDTLSALIWPCKLILEHEIVSVAGFIVSAQIVLSEHRHGFLTDETNSHFFALNKKIITCPLLVK